MEHYINKNAIVAKIEKEIKKLQDLLKEKEKKLDSFQQTAVKLCIEECRVILSLIDTLEVGDPYEQCIQYSSIEDGIKAHAETYSFNIEGELFNQLTKEQQKLWRKEIEQACISGGDAGVGLARDIRYKENLEVKEVDLEREIQDYFVSMEVKEHENIFESTFQKIAKHFFELGMSVSNKAQKGE